VTKNPRVLSSTFPPPTQDCVLWFAYLWVLHCTYSPESLLTSPLPPWGFRITFFPAIVFFYLPRINGFVLLLPCVCVLFFLATFVVSSTTYTSFPTSPRFSGPHMYLLAGLSWHFLTRIDPRPCAFFCFRATHPPNGFFFIVYFVHLSSPFLSKFLLAHQNSCSLSTPMRSLLSCTPFSTSRFFRWLTLFH